MPFSQSLLLITPQREQRMAGNPPCTSPVSPHSPGISLEHFGRATVSVAWVSSVLTAEASLIPLWALGYYSFRPAGVPAGSLQRHPKLQRTGKWPGKYLPKKGKQVTDTWLMSAQSDFFPRSQSYHAAATGTSLSAFPRPWNPIVPFRHLLLALCPAAMAPLASSKNEYRQ